jgi:uncharacterized protein
MTIKLSGLSQEETDKIVPDGTILLGYRGSIAHGMYVPSTDPNSIDDKDIMGVAIAPLSVYFGLDNFEQKEVMYGAWDSVVYELRKFVRLLYGSNPNVMSLLWNERQHYIHISELGQALIDSRAEFVSKKAYKAFTGYAYGQLVRMTHFKGAFEGYMGAKRKGLVEKFGYDTKNAAHCIRLLRMGIEFLNDGKLYVDRSKHDGPQLLCIKRGEWSLQEVEEETKRLFKRAEEAYDRCSLPLEPDYGKINNLLTSMLTKHFWPYPVAAIG